MSEPRIAGTDHRQAKQILALAFLILVALVGIYAPSITDILMNGIIVRHSGNSIGHFQHGSIVSHRFDIWNVSLRTVVIGLVEPSCSCSVAAVSNYRIPPLRKSTITMKVNTGDLGLGNVVKGVRVTLMDGRSLDKCYVKFVIDRPTGKRTKK